MKRVFLLGAMSLAFTLGVLCQDAASISTSTLDWARFEVLHSPLDHATTFRLDKWTGVIDRLGTCPRDDGYGSKLCWKEMTVLDISKAAQSGKPHYQIIVNGPLKTVSSGVLLVESA